MTPEYIADYAWKHITGFETNAERHKEYSVSQVLFKDVVATVVRAVVEKERSDCAAIADNEAAVSHKLVNEWTEDNDTDFLAQAIEAEIIARKIRARNQTPS